MLIKDKRETELLSKGTVTVGSHVWSWMCLLNNKCHCEHNLFWSQRQVDRILTWQLLIITCCEVIDTLLFWAIWLDLEKIHHKSWDTVADSVLLLFKHWWGVKRAIPPIRCPKDSIAESSPIGSPPLDVVNELNFSCTIYVVYDEDEFFM